MTASRWKRAPATGRGGMRCAFRPTHATNLACVSRHRAGKRRATRLRRRDGGLHPPYARYACYACYLDKDVGRMQSACFARVPCSSMVKLLVRPVSP